jgi:hypothetical protein
MSSLLDIIDRKLGDINLHCAELGFLSRGLISRLLCPSEIFLIPIQETRKNAIKEVNMEVLSDLALEIPNEGLGDDATFNFWSH